MAKQETTTRTTWKDEHITSLLQHSPEIGFISESSALADLITRAQRKALPKSFHRNRSQIMHSLGTPPTRPISPLREHIARIVQEMPEAAAPEAVAGTTTDDTQSKLIRWRMVEWTRLAHDEEIKRLLALPAEPDSVMLLEALMRAMKRQLHESRWRTRKLVQSSMYAKAELGKRGAIGLLREGIKYQPTEPIRSIHEPMPQATQTGPQETLQEAVKEDAAPAPLAAPAQLPGGTLGGALASLINVAIGKLREGIVESVNQGIDRALSQALTDATAQLQASNTATITQLLGGAIEPMQSTSVVLPPTEKFKGPRVDIVGLLNGQAEQVKKAVGESFDLRFLSADDIERHPVTAPCAIMMTKFVSHSAQERIKKQGKQLVFANGGIESVLKELSAMKH